MKKLQCPVCRKNYKTKLGLSGHLKNSKDQDHIDYQNKKNQPIEETVVVHEEVSEEVPEVSDVVSEEVQEVSEEVPEVVIENNKVVKNKTDLSDEEVKEAVETAVQIDPDDSVEEINEKILNQEKIDLILTEIKTRFNIEFSKDDPAINDYNFLENFLNEKIEQSNQISVQEPQDVEVEEVIEIKEEKMEAEVVGLTADQVSSGYLVKDVYSPASKVRKLQEKFEGSFDPIGFNVTKTQKIRI